MKRDEAVIRFFHAVAIFDPLREEITGRLQTGLPRHVDELMKIPGVVAAGLGIDGIHVETSKPETFKMIGVSDKE